VTRPDQIRSDQTISDQTIKHLETARSVNLNQTDPIEAIVVQLFSQHGRALDCTNGNRLMTMAAIQKVPPFTLSHTRLKVRPQ